MVNGREQADCQKNETIEAIIALGSNLPAGDLSPAQAVTQAMDRIGAGRELARSRLFQTPAFPPGSGPDFVNAAMRVSWDGSAGALLALLNQVEAEFGRTRQKRWEARIMDLDLIAFGAAVLPDRTVQAAWAGLDPSEAAKSAPEQLIVPHPRMAERSFVLVPMADVAAGWRHPITGQSVTEMILSRPEAERAEIVPLS